MSTLPKYDPIAEMPDDEKERHQALRSALFMRSPKAIDRYIDSTVKDLDDAKTVLKLLARAVCALGAEQRDRRNRKN